MEHFSHHGFFKDYYVNGKFIGSVECEKDRDILGYYGRKTEVVNESINLSNKKKIKTGSEVVTELNFICGKIN